MNIIDSEEFNKWNRLKTKINSYKNEIFFKERQVRWVNFGKNIGDEQDGKNENFTRPVVIIKKFNEGLFWGIPTSTKIKINKYYYIFEINNEKYSAIISQLRILSVKRISRLIGNISRDDFDNIKKRIKDLL